MGTCKCRADWGDFLHIRHLLINEWLNGGKSPAHIAETLSMDPMQVQLIGLTPLGSTHLHLTEVSRSEGGRFCPRRRIWGSVDATASIPEGKYGAT